MHGNDRIILDQVLCQKRENLAPSLDSSAYFEVFVAEQLLKDYDLSYDELESGLVGGGGDGGIDGFFTFVNGDLVQEDTDVGGLKRDVHVEVVIVQSKTSAGFSEDAMDRFAAAADDLFDLMRGLDSLSTVYNTGLREAAQRFRNVYQLLAAAFPKLTVRFCYATKGNEVHANVDRKKLRIEETVRSHFSSANFVFEFLGARHLLDLARREPTSSHVLKLAENPISATGDAAFICLVSLADFRGFIVDAHGQLKRHIFEANVRDYQGKTQVNEQILDSLRNPRAEDFWWLNNGVTVLANRATLSGKALTIENPEIVNGLQTSTEVNTYFASSNTSAETRCILVRVIVPRDAGSRDRIIKATNSQTALPPASLRATDPIHHDIEMYLHPFSLYYDRRKNYYKNDGKSINRIIGIPQMAQAVMAILLRRPDNARARPSSLLKANSTYEQLFSRDYPIGLYRTCAEAIKQTEAFLSSHADALSAADKNNLKFYVAMAAVQETLADPAPEPLSIAQLAGSAISSGALSAAYNVVNTVYTELGRSDQIAKGSELLPRVNRQMELKYARKPSGTHPRRA